MSRCDVRGFWDSDDSTSKRVLDVLQSVYNFIWVFDLQSGGCFIDRKRD